jgi:WD repeat-containing protein 61
MPVNSFNQPQTVGHTRIKVVDVRREAQCIGHQDCIYAVTAFRGDRSFYTGGADGMVVQWNLDSPETGEMVAKVGSTVYSLCPMPEQRHIVVGQNFEGIHIIDPGTRKEVGSLKMTDAAIFDMMLVGRMLFIACGDGYLVAVDTQEWRTLARIRISEKSLRSLAYNSATHELAVGASDHLITIVDAETLTVRHRIEGHTNSVFALAFAPHADRLLSAGRDAHLRIFDVSSGYTLIEDIIPHMYTVNDIIFNPSGRLFATCSKDKSIRIWDPDGLRALRTIDRSSSAGHGTSVNRLLWMDDRTLVSVSDDRTASIWSLGLEA